MKCVGTPMSFEVLEHVFRDPVVEDALALDHLVFLGIEGGRIVLEVLDQGSRLGAFVQDLGLAFVDAASAAHWDVPCFVEIHEFGVLRMTRVCDHDGAAVKAWNLETERRTKPVGNLSDWPIQHNRPGPMGPNLYRLPCGLTARCFCRFAPSIWVCEPAAATRLRFTIWPGLEPKMTTFDKREDGFEKKFAVDEELKFKAVARRNKLLGQLIAEKLGMSGEAAAAYARRWLPPVFEGDGDVLRKVLGDIRAKGVEFTEQDLRNRMDELMAQAVARGESEREGRIGSGE